MSKKRTRKQKQNPNHQFVLSWSPDSKPASDKASVKGQKNIGYEAKNSFSQTSNNANLSAQASHIKSIKKNLLKSLIIVSFILCLELVLYLAWNIKR